MNRSLTARRTLAATALAPLLLTGFAACGDSGEPESKASDTTATQVSALSGLEKGEQVDPDAFVDTVADGVKESTTAHITMDMSTGATGGMSATGDVDYTTSPASMAMSMELPGGISSGKADLRLVDGVMYMSMGQLSDNKFWKIDPSDPDGPLGGLGLNKLLDQSDPIAAMKAMQPGIESVTYEGAEKVDGRDLDHYGLTIDLQQALAGTGTDLPKKVESAMPDEITYDMWLDDADRFAQMSMDYPVMDQQMSMKMTATDWGTDVDIEAPPADQVTDMPDFSSMMPSAPSA